MNGILKAPQAAPVQSVNGKTGAVEINDLYTSGGIKAMQTEVVGNRSYYLISLRPSSEPDKPTAAFYGEIVDDTVWPTVRTERSAGAGAQFQRIYTSYHKPTASDVGAVPTSRKVNGKALGSDVTLAATDISGIGVLSAQIITLTAPSTPAGQTATATGTFNSVSGATSYAAVPMTGGTDFFRITGNPTISGTTVKAEVYNFSGEAHTASIQYLVFARR